MSTIEGLEPLVANESKYLPWINKAVAIETECETKVQCEYR